MSSCRWTRVREILEDILEQAPADRSQYVAQACGGDSDLEREVQEYLRYQDVPEPVLAVSGWAQNPPDSQEESPDPERIGVYRVLRRLGEGGMGIVYLAERDDEEYRQQVAVKALRPGIQSSRLLNLFRRERQILAELQHPNIAHLMDGGTSAHQIFYVMEYIDGLPITMYSRDHELTIPQRLNLFCRVCEAVSYAHRKLVIHRDLKPGNILVTADGIPKLLDFGLAKVFREGALNQSATMSIGPMMTPAYASPEQVRGEHLSTATDVYSLGVLLYELLTGENPYLREKKTGEEKSPLEVCRTILDGDPRPPSQAVTASRRRQLAGDLDNIVLMALRKEPDRRYRSVEEFQRDIERYLNGFPVVASRGTLRYRLRKFVGRHRWSLIASALGTVLAVAATAMIWWQGRQAEMRFNDVRELAHSVIFELHDQVRDLPGSTAARKLIVERALQYLRKLEASGSRRRDLQLELASAYQKIGQVQSNNSRGSLGDTTGALESYLAARRFLDEVLRAHPGDFEAQQLLCGLNQDLANVYEQRGDERARAEASRQAAQLQWELAKRRPENPALKAAALRLSANNLNMVSHWDAAMPLWKQAIDAYEAVRAQGIADYAILHGLAQSHEGLGQACNESYRPDLLPCAVEHYAAALRIEEDRLAANPKDTLMRMAVAYHAIDLGWVEHRLGRWKEAYAHERRAIEIQQALADEDPQNVMARLEVGKSLITLGLTYRDGNELGEAVRALRQAAGIFRATLLRDTGNQSTLFYAAWADAELGDVYIRRAQAPGLSATQSRQEWTNAKASFERSSDCLAKLKLGGKIGGAIGDETLRLVVPAQLDKCKRHLAQASKLIPAASFHFSLQVSK